MALVDLSRFSPDIRQDNRQRQVFSNEGAEVYESLARVSQGVANYGIELVKKDRIKQHADYQTKVATDLSESETQFDTEWAVAAKSGQTRNDKGLSYLEAKNDFLRVKINEARENAPDQGLFAEYSNTLEKYRSASTVDAIKKNYQLGIEASEFNWKKLGEESGRQFTSIETGNYNTAWQKKKLELDALYADTSMLSVSVANKNRKELEQGLANIIVDKNMSVDWSRHNIIDVVNEIMPLEVVLSSDNTRLTINQLKDYAITASPEELKTATSSYLQIVQANLEQARTNIQRNSSLPSSQISKEDFKAANEKIDKGIATVVTLANQMNTDEHGALNLDAIDLEAEFTPAQARAISRGNAEIWNSLKADKQLDYMSGILKWKAESNSASKADLTLQINNLKANVNDLSGKGGLTLSGLNRYTGGPDGIANLIRTNPEIVKGEETIYTTHLYESVMDKLTLDNALRPATMGSRGYDAAALHYKAIDIIKGYQLSALEKGLATGAFGAGIRAEYHIKQLEKFNKMRAYADRNPRGALMALASDDFFKSANDVMKSGTFNSDAYKKMEAKAKRTLNPFVTSMNKSGIDDAIVAPLVATLKNDILTARANGDDNYDRLVNKVLPKDPDLFATIAERMLVKGTDEEKGTIRSIIFKRQHGTPENAEMTNAVLKANTAPELKAVNELIKSDSNFKVKTEKARKAVAGLLSDFYSEGKGTVNLGSSVGAGNALVNYINSALITEQGSDPKVIAQRAFDVFYGNKLSIGNSTMRGTVLKKPNETQGDIEDAAEDALDGFRKRLKAGERIDIEGMPLTKEMIDTGMNFKTTKGFNKFLDYGFELQLQTVDDSGRDREVIPVLLDKNSKVKYRIRDANKNIIRMRLP